MDNTYLPTLLLKTNDKYKYFLYLCESLEKSLYFCSGLEESNMVTKDKLIERFKRLPKDFTFDELTRLLEIYGFEISNKGKTSGSRVVFKNGEKKPIMLHKPHPGNIVKGYALKQVFNYLKELGLIK